MGVEQKDANLLDKSEKMLWQKSLHGAKSA